jgi:hypothetical protein
MTNAKASTSSPLTGCMPREIYGAEQRFGTNVAGQAHCHDFAHANLRARSAANYIFSCRVEAVRRLPQIACTAHQRRGVAAACGTCLLLIVFSS